MSPLQGDYYTDGVGPSLRWRGGRGQPNEHQVITDTRVKSPLHEPVQGGLGRHALEDVWGAFYAGAMVGAHKAYTRGA